MYNGVLPRLMVASLLAITLVPTVAQAIPAWARRYNMNCSGCHSPAVPRLNAVGIAFKWAGYRMPDAIGEAADMSRIENYLAARLEAEFGSVRPASGDAEASGFSFPSASLFAAGAVGGHAGAYVEFDREPEGTIDLVGTVTGVWGSENRYAGVRVGQGHLLAAGGGVAGFDRATGLSTPLALDESVTEVIPARLAGDQVGVEAFVVLGGRMRTSLMAINGIVLGADEEGAAVSRRDLVFTNQLMWDDAGSGIGLAAYLGDALGVIEQSPNQGRRFYRIVATANKIYNGAELSGGYVLGRDRDVPTGDPGAPEIRSPRGSSYWVQGQYSWTDNAYTVFGRQERLDPDVGRSAETLSRSTVGVVVPLNVPEYFRWSLELFRDSYSADTPARSGLVTRLMVAF